jgi:protein involved in polysaccharide export with SLBB domain
LGGEPAEGAPAVQTVAWRDPGPRHGDRAAPRQDELPKELNKVTMPPYVIEPPDVLLIDLTRGPQQVRGEHLVRPDGTVSLGAYGEAYVAGMTLAQARQAIAAQLSQALPNPEVTVDVLANNSKVYYVIYDGGCFGQQMFRRPLVGGETVLDAISELRGLPAASSTKRIWIARPVPGQVGCRQVLPVDWAAITEGAATNTNYQLFPGDRVYVKADRLAVLKAGVSKLLAPVGQMCSFPRPWEVP